MLHYAHAFFNQVAQSAACNHRHKIEQRCCRWLLMAHDRVHSDQFLLTQEFLGMMLGVRRTSVTEVAGELKHQKLIDYSRGLVTILNRSGLEKRACECYAASKKDFDRLLGHPLRLREPLSDESQTTVRDCLQDWTSTRLRRAPDTLP
jgi:hypothetical protein